MTARLLAGTLAFALLTIPAGSHAPDLYAGRTLQAPSESWYLHGIVRSKSGRPFAFSIAFRSIVFDATHGALRRRSHWHAQEIVACGVTLADIAHRKVWHAERIDRAAFGFASARHRVPEIRVGTWSLSQTHRSLGARFELTIRAATPQFAIQFVNTANTANPEGVFTGFQSRGTIVLDGATFGVSGIAGLEHRFGLQDGDGRSSETFALQLNDGREALLHIVPNQGGQTIAASGTLIERGGAVVRLARYDFGVGEWAATHWRSPHTGISYPSLWVVGIPRANLSVTVSPVLGDQEIVPLADGRPYWAGPVDVTDNLRRTGRTGVGTGWVMLAGFGVAG